MMAMIARYLKPAVLSSLSRQYRPKNPEALRIVLFVIGFFTFSVVSLHGWGQISLTNGSPTNTQNFDGMGATLNLPANWEIQKSATPTWAGGLTTVTQQASSGSPTTGGSYNWGAGAAERALGAMTSGSYSSPNSIMAFYSNGGSTNITQLTIAYDLERYRINSAAASVQFYYSLDGSSWTSVSSGDIAAASLPTGSNAYFWAPSGTPTTTNGGVINMTGITISSLSIIPSSVFYLRWNLNTTGSNSQGIGIDNVSITATFSAGGTPSIVLSSSNPAVAAANITQSSTKNAIYKFTTAITVANATLNSVAFNTTNTSASDITKYQLWYYTLDNFASASQIGSDITTSLGTGTHTFSGLSQAINSGTTGYFWITTDVASGATGGNTIIVSIITTSDLTFVSGTKSGTAYAGGTQTIATLGGGCASDLIISEYGEGTSSNKYIEIYNGTGSSVDLSNYSLKQDNAGDNDWDYSLALSGTLANDDVFVIVDDVASAGLLTYADLTTNSSVMDFNGNDPIGLFKSTTLIDLCGYQDASTWGQDMTLVRKESITVPSIVFDKTNDWTQYSVDTWTYLGDHSMSCCPTLLVSPSNLSGISYMVGYGPSSCQTYSINGMNLSGSGDITITGSTNYEVSSNGSSYSSSITFPYASGIITGQPKTVYVRMKSGLSVGNYNSEIISNAGGGATTVNVTCNGTVTALSAWFVNEGFDNVTNLTTLASTTSPSFSGSVFGGGDLQYQTSSGVQLWNRNANSLSFEGTAGGSVTITTPTFSNADLLSFWYHQNSSASNNPLVVEQNDGAKGWTTLATIIGDAEPRVYFYPLAANIIQIRFTYTRTSITYQGYFDDVRIRRNGACSNNIQILQTLIYSCGGDEGINESVTFKTGGSPVSVDDLAVSFPSVGTGGTEYSMESAQKFTTNSAYVTALNNLVHATYPACSPVVEPPSGIIPANSYVVIFTGSSPTVIYDFTNACSLGRIYYAIFCDNTNTNGRYDNDPSGDMQKYTALFDMSTGCFDSVHYDAGFNESEGGLANYAEGTGVRTYDNWGCEIVLPIELVSFTANCEEDNVAIQWITASETNNDYFTLEKSKDLLSWYSIANIPGAGNSNGSLVYTYNDDNPYDETFYYRLKQTDYNGKYAYFGPYSITCDPDNDFMINLYPDPATFVLNSNIYCSEESLATIEIINIYGQRIYGRNYLLQKGFNNISFDISESTGGLYYFKIYTMNGRDVKTKPFIKL